MLDSEMREGGKALKWEKGGNYRCVIWREWIESVAESFEGSVAWKGEIVSHIRAGYWVTFFFVCHASVCADTVQHLGFNVPDFGI